MLKEIKGNLIVSCQALPFEPLYSPYVMGKMALAAKLGGAKAIRAQGISDIIEIKRVTNLPVIGIIKRDYEGSEVYITPTKAEIDELLTTKCEMIALDVTKRPRPKGENVKDLIKYIKDNGVLVMGDVSNLEEGIIGESLGCDVISTTLSGYTSYTSHIKGVDLKLIEDLVKTLKIPVISEGRINTPHDLKKVKSLNPYSYVVGSAITRPNLITKFFADALK